FVSRHNEILGLKFGFCAVQIGSGLKRFKFFWSEFFKVFSLLLRLCIFLLGNILGFSTSDTNFYWSSRSTNCQIEWQCLSVQWRIAGILGDWPLIILNLSHHARSNARRIPQH